MAIVTFIREFHCKKNSFCHKTLQNILDDYALTLYGLNKNTYKEMMEKSYNTVDLYGLGGGLMYVLNYTYKFLDSDFVQDLSDLFYHMYHPNLFERYTIENALAKYEQLLEKYLLESSHKEFVNHMIQSISQSKKNITNSLKTISIEKVIKSAKLDKTIIDGPVRQCADDKELNPFTNRCVKKCESGYKRNEKFQCKKDVSKKCTPGKERNPYTDRCVKKCESGYKRNEKFQCVKNMSKKCPSGKERNPKTRRCVKKCKDDYSRNKDFKCVKTRKIRKDS